MKAHTKTAIIIGIIPALMAMFPWPCLGGRDYAWIQVTGVAVTVLVLVAWAIYDLHGER